MKKILNIIKQVEQGKITSEESVELIKKIVLEFEEDELLDYAFPFHRQTKKDLQNITKNTGLENIFKL